MPRAVPLSLFLAFAVGCAPPKASVGPDSKTPFQVQAFALVSDVDGKPGKEVETFDYRQRTQRFRVRLDRAAKGEKAVWIFTAKNTVAGSGKQIKTLEGNVEGDEMRAEVTLANDWPVGTYAVDVTLDGEKLLERDYVVTGQSQKLVFGAHSIAADDGHGLPGPKRESLKSTERKIHLQVSTRGIDTTKPKVVWRIFRKRGNGEVEIGSVEQPALALQDSMLKAEFLVDRDWRPGTYVAQIEVAGKPAHRFTFEIE
ncbi:MAG: hypothetical protein JST30_13430 [Armatimonadetes bacterium]|nr:hypothetical protein [Armatimonadota bacterium]